MILAYQRNEFRSIWLQSKAIMFMGTPHRGSAYASYGKILGDIVNVTMHVSLTHRFTGGVKTALIESLVRNNEELQAISEDFYPLIQQSSIHITSFYETEANPLTNKTVGSFAIIGGSAQKADQPIPRLLRKALPILEADSSYHCTSITKSFVDFLARKIQTTSKYQRLSNLRLSSLPRK